jgi:hypothetical protein
MLWLVHEMKNLLEKCNTMYLDASEDLQESRTLLQNIRYRYKNLNDLQFMRSLQRADTGNMTLSTPLAVNRVGRCSV